MIILLFLFGCRTDNCSWFVPGATGPAQILLSVMGGADSADLCRHRGRGHAAVSQSVGQYGVCPHRHGRSESRARRRHGRRAGCASSDSANVAENDAAGTSDARGPASLITKDNLPASIWRLSLSADYVQAKTGDILQAAYSLGEAQRLGLTPETVEGGKRSEQRVCTVAATGIGRSCNLKRDELAVASAVQAVDRDPRSGLQRFLTLESVTISSLEIKLILSNRAGPQRV